MTVVALFLVPLLLGASCEESSDDSDEPRCIPGETRACHCVDGKSGRQVCAQDGKSLEECECGGATKTDASGVPTMPPPPTASPSESPTSPPGLNPAVAQAQPTTLPAPSPATPVASLPPIPPPGPASKALTAPHVPDQGTLALWHLDDGNGEVARDFGIFGINGLARNVSWGAGRFGGAALFNGSNVNIQAATQEGLFPTKSITVEAWARPETSASMTIYDIQDTQGLSLRPRGTDLEAVFTLRINDTVRTLVSTEPLSTQQWHHIAGTFDGVFLRLWINGELAGELNAQGTLSRARLCDTPTIGSTCPASGGWFNGSIDEVRISKIARYVPTGPTPQPSVASGPADAGAEPAKTNSGGRSKGTTKVVPNPIDLAKKGAQDARRILGL